MVNLTPNVYAHWKLNESSGVLVNDSSVNGRDGTLINMEDSDWVAGKLNNCLRFNEGSTNEYVDFTSIAGFQETDPFSLEYWIKIESLPTANTRVMWKYAASRGYLSYVVNSGIVQFFMLAGTGRIHVHGNTNINDGAWHHVITTYDGSKTAAGVQIYVDGNPEIMGVLQDNLVGSILNAVSLKLSDVTSTYCLHGYLDEAVIYDKELSQTEVTFRWNGGNGTEDMEDVPPVPPSNPIPIDTATSIPYNQNLDWDADTGNLFDVYFGTSSPPPLVQENHPTSDYTIPYNLDSCTIYYWKIVATSIYGSTPGPEWSFTTRNEQPITPNTPSPAHNANNQTLALILTWDCEDYNPNDTVTYDIYFGKTAIPPLVKSNHPVRAYIVSGLDNDQNYYWRIVARDDATCGVHEITSPTWKFTTREEALGGYKSYDPREVIRENIGKSKYRVGDSEEEYWMFEVKDKLTDDIEIPLYLAEEVKSGSIKEMPFIDMNLMQVEYAPHDIGARTRRHKAWLDIGLWYADTDNIDRHDFGKKIVDKLIDKIRSTQCGMTHIDFINVESVRLLREPGAHQVIYHYVISIYCLFYDLGTDSY